MENLGREIERCRNKLSLNQSEFGALFGTTAMAISRWERGVNSPASRALLKLGLLARKAGLGGWAFWELAGISRADARAALALQARAAAAGRR